MADAPENPQPWVQPLFMVYDIATDNKVPLTQARLSQLLATERQYGQMICDIRSAHESHVRHIGGMPKPWAE